MIQGLANTVAGSDFASPEVSRGDDNPPGERSLGEHRSRVPRGRVRVGGWMTHAMIRGARPLIDIEGDAHQLVPGFEWSVSADNGGNGVGVSGEVTGEDLRAGVGSADVHDVLEANAAKLLL